MEIIKRLKIIIYFIILLSFTFYVQAQEVNKLSVKEQSIITISALAAKGDLERLKTAIKQGIEAGMTINEVKEVMVHLYAYAGFPRSIRGLQTTIEVLDERKAKGIQDEPGSKASVITDSRPKYQRGKENLETLINAKLDGPQKGYAQFSPEIEVFLKEHLFADIFERDVLTFRERELSTVSTLIGIGDVEPMMQAHMNICLIQGLTPDQLQQLVNIATSYVGHDKGNAAQEVLDELFKNRNLTTTINNSNTKIVTKLESLMIQKQGSFAIGGKVKASEGTFDPIAHGSFNPANQSTEGQTLHGDHATVFYQIPVEARSLPLVFWHGYGQSMRTWQTTPDGRDGFQNIFLRNKYPVYLIDQPRRGLSGRSTEPTTINAATDDQLWFGIFRLGVGTEFYPNVQFSQKPEALNQFYRQITPDTGPLNVGLNIDAVSALFNKLGKGILVTHSHSGGQGWLAALRNDNIKAIVSYEPGSNFVFPEGKVPEPISYVGGTLRANGVAMEVFEKLTKIPIVIYYGDFIPETEVENPGQEQWRAALMMARKWTKTVNDAGGDVTLVVLPDKGVKGNTHFPMSDLNNQEIANLMYEWLAKKELN